MNGLQVAGLSGSGLGVKGFGVWVERIGKEVGCRGWDVGFRVQGLGWWKHLLEILGETSP